MKISVERFFQASLDDGLTVTDFLPGVEVEVDERIGKLAVKRKNAKEVKKRQPRKR